MSKKEKEASKFNQLWRNSVAFPRTPSLRSLWPVSSIIVIKVMDIYVGPLLNHCFVLQSQTVCREVKVPQNLTSPPPPLPQPRFQHSLLPSKACRWLLAVASLSASALLTEGKKTESGMPLDALWNRKPRSFRSSRQPLAPLTLASMLASAVYIDDRWPWRMRCWALSI